MTSIPNTAVVDTAKVRLGAGCRKPADAPVAPAPATLAAVADSGKVRLGAGCRRR
jgi:hypothetical protein